MPTVHLLRVRCLLGQEDNHIVPSLWKLAIWWWKMLPAVVLTSVVKVQAEGWIPSHGVHMREGMGLVGPHINGHADTAGWATFLPYKIHKNT